MSMKRALMVLGLVAGTVRGEVKVEMAGLQGSAKE